MPLSAFHPVVARWFRERLGEPADAQVRSWPLVAAGKHVLLAAPTGSGKTLAAFLQALSGLLTEGDALRDETAVLYVSPLKALGNDVQKNLAGPLAEMRLLDPSLPEVRVLVRSGDTPQARRQAMVKKPPHILVTTPESLYILLTSEGGRSLLKTVRSVIVDEIHAVLGSKRGSHLALSLERLAALAGDPQRIGLSATQKPVEDVARFLVGVGRECEVVDIGHGRRLDLAVEVPPSPLEAVCSHETWSEIYERITTLIGEHRTTLIFVGTRKMAERVAAQLAKLLGEDLVTCHHSSLAKERRLDAERRLKAGELRALVATASLELGIDIGDVDLVVQVGAARSIATLLQRVGRAGHSPGRLPKGRLFPLTMDELGEATALMRAVGAGALDRTPQPGHPLDILAQQIVAACAAEPWDEAELFERMRRAWPYRDLARADFDAVVALHTVSPRRGGRSALLHRDGVGGRLLGTKRARLTAITSGGAIPDLASYRVLLEPEGTLVGTIDEDFAIESNAGDVFQLGNASWRVLRVEPGTMRVADAKGAPPSLPFWVGEAPARTAELATEISAVRERALQIGQAAASTSRVPGARADELASAPAADWLEAEGGLPAGGARQLAEYLEASRRALGTLPTHARVVAERFFDETGGMQLVIHSPFGNRINRAWGLALRKRFCRGFGFELQAAAGEEAIILSLSPQHSFPLEDVFDYLHPATARKVLEQAVLASPFFETRWRRNIGRALLLPRSQGGRRVPVPLQRMRAQDLLADAFPQLVACPENLPGGDLPIPMEHPLVRQTLHDCLTEVMDVEGFLQVIADLHAGTLERVAIDTPEPSPLCRGILSSKPYGFLDDAPLEERRTQAVMSRRILDVKTADELGALDAAAVQRVREEAWPQPENFEEVHEALLWMGYATAQEAERSGWSEWLAELAAAGRAQLQGERWFATETLADPAALDPKILWRGRLEALGPVFDSDPVLGALEAEGFVLRVRLDGGTAWCERRLLARIHRYTVERLRQEIAPVSAAQFLRFLMAWQHVEEGTRLEGPNGVRLVLEQLAGFEAPASAWESSILPARVQGYRREWLDQLTLSGELTWGRLWGSGACAVRTAPVTFVRREELESWCDLADGLDLARLSGAGRDLLSALGQRGAMFPQELARATGLLPAQIELAIGELIAHGAITCDSFAALRQLLVPPSRRRRQLGSVGRYCALRAAPAEGGSVPAAPRAPACPQQIELVARQLLARYGVVMRRVLLRERIPVPWRDLARHYRTLELRGDIRGGRFVAGLSGEQFATPGAVELLRQHRREEVALDGTGRERAALELGAADPLNLQGILTPDDRVPGTRKRKVLVG